MGNQELAPMATILLGMMKGSERLSDRPIQARWRGGNLAVHAAMVYRYDIQDVGPATKESTAIWRWCVTHLATGFSAARFMHLTDAMNVAKLFDSLFTYSTGEEMKENKELVALFTEEVKNNGGILC